MRSYIRTLRTPFSERFLVHESGADIAAVDLHYLLTGKVSGTLILLTAVPESKVAELLGEIDENLLPDVSFEQQNISFTVVRGTVVGAYEAGPDDDNKA